MNKQALSLAVFIAGAYPAASSALGLGDIESSSHLNQPLRAKINLLSATPADASQIQVRLASPEVFNRVGVARPNFLGSLRFQPSVQGGRPVILVTSSAPIQEPFVNFLLEVSWPQGQLLKEYTVMLDPPVLMQPGSTVAGEAAVRAEPKAAGSVRREQQQARQQTRRQTAAAAPARSSTPRPSKRTYRVRSGDTLFKVASRLRQPGVTNDQMMMALFRANPNAFINNNINNLKSGVVLKAPSANKVKSLSRAEARRQIRQQHAEWRNLRTSLAKKTVPQKSVAPVAKQSVKQTNTKSNRIASNQQQDKARLEVLGTNKGKGASNAASAGANSAKLSELEKQLSLARESLTTRQQENRELKSRVSDLESVLSKKNRLIELRNQQLADLQKQLSQQGDKPASATPTAPTKPAAIMPPANGETKQAVDQGKDIQAQVANMQGKDADTVIRNGQQASNNDKPQETTKVEPSQPVRPMTPAGAALGGGSTIPLKPPTEVDQPESSTPPTSRLTPSSGLGNSNIPLTPPSTSNADAAGSGQQDSSTTTPLPSTSDSGTDAAGQDGDTPPRVFADQKDSVDELLELLTSPLALKIGAGSLALLALLWLLGRRRKSEPEDPEAQDQDGQITDLDAELDDQLDLNSLESELEKAEHRGGDITRGGFDEVSGETDPFGIKGSDSTGGLDEWSNPNPSVNKAAADSLDSGVDTGILESSDVPDEDELLTEANVYIAYGLYQQAESELKKGIERSPEKLEYRHKLLECYFNSNNRESFDAQAQQFAGLEGSNKAELWKAVAEWGRKISPDNTVYQGDGIVATSVGSTADNDDKDGGSGLASTAGLAAGAAGAALAQAAFADDEVGNVTQTIGDSTNLDLDLDQSNSELAAPTLPQQADDALDLDFDLDLDLNNDSKLDTPDLVEGTKTALDDTVVEVGQAVEKAKDEVLETAPVVGDDLDLGDMDFDDIDLDKLLQGDDYSVADSGNTAATKPATPEASATDNSLDLDLDLPDLDLNDSTSTQATTQPAVDNDLNGSLDVPGLDDLPDLDLDFPADDVAPTTPAPAVAPKADKSDANDLLDFDLGDFDTDEANTDTQGGDVATATAVTAAAAAAAQQPATNLNLHLDSENVGRILPQDTFYKQPEGEEGEQDWLGDIDDALSFLDFPDEEIDLHEAHISTKLDLARAYLDMGDIEGARSTLEEVMVEGNDDQRREAEVLLHQSG